MKLMARPITAAALLVGSAHLAASSAAYADTLTLRAECRKTSDKGCTAAHSVCAAAPTGMYIRPSSMSTGTIRSHWGKNPTCRIARAAGHVVYITPDTGVEAQLATSMCADLHIESGSGLDNLGMVAFVDCGYDVVFGDIP